jgi:hypothetical protein
MGLNTRIHPLVAAARVRAAQPCRWCSSIWIYCDQFPPVDGVQPPCQEPATYPGLTGGQIILPERRSTGRPSTDASRAWSEPTGCTGRRRATRPHSYIGSTRSSISSPPTRCVCRVAASGMTKRRHRDRPSSRRCADSSICCLRPASGRHEHGAGAASGASGGGRRVPRCRRLACQRPPALPACRCVLSANRLHDELTRLARLQSGRPRL